MANQSPTQKASRGREGEENTTPLNDDSSKVDQRERDSNEASEEENKEAILVNLFHFSGREEGCISLFCFVRIPPPSFSSLRLKILGIHDFFSCLHMPGYLLFTNLPPIS